MLQTKRAKRIISILSVFLLIVCLSTAAFADTTNTDVAGGVVTAFGTYMKPQIKSFTNGIIFPIVDVILLIGVVVRSVMSGLAYRHQGGQFEWHLLGVLAGGLVVSLTAPLWIWNIIHW